MKLFLVLFIMLIATVSSSDFKTSRFKREDPHFVEQYKRECRVELSIPESQKDNYGSVHASGPLKECFVQCVMSKWGLYNKEKGFDVQALFKMIPKFNPKHVTSDDVLLDKIKKCAKEAQEVDQTKNGCERGYIGAMCLLKSFFQ